MAGFDSSHRPVPDWAIAVTQPPTCANNAQVPETGKTRFIPDMSFIMQQKHNAAAA